MIETGLDRGPNTESTTAGPEELPSNSDELRKEFLSVLRTVEACEGGDLSARPSSCKGMPVSHQLLSAMDDLIVEEYEKGERSLWRLNCLVYAGAELVSSRVKQNLARMTKKQPSQKRKVADVRQLRRQIGWLEAEIHRRKSGKRPTPRQWRNLRLLHAERTGLRELEVSLESRKAKLRVRAAQLRRLRAAARSSFINSAYRRHGISCLQKGSGRGTDGIQHPSADAVSGFWESVIGVEGEWDPQDPDLVDWALGMSDEPMPEDVELVDGTVWGKVVKKLNSWKAPGRDGICGYWWKHFCQATVPLGRAVWDMLEEGDSDNIPTWFVKGRTVLIPKAGCEGRPEQYQPITCLNTAYISF